MKKVFTHCLVILSTFLISHSLYGNCASGQLTLTLNLDNNPSQVNWEIKNTANAIVAWSGGVPYPATSANQTITETIPTLPAGDYTLIVYDAGGDGLCCASGGGSFQLTDGTNASILQGSIYGYSSLQAFCIGSTNNFTFDLTAPTASVLTASNVTATTVDLSWTPATDNVGVTTYGVFYNDVYFGDLNATSVTAPIPGGVTNIFIVSRDEIGNFSPKSNTVTVMPTNGVTTSVFSQSYFETGWDDWFDGGNDCFRYTGTNFSSEGQRSIRLRDNSGRRSSMTSKPFDFTPYDSVRIQFAYYHRNFENGEDFFIKLRENGSYNTIASFSKPTDFNANGFYSVNVLMKASEVFFQTNSRLRIQCDASVNNDQLYIDQVILTGYTSSSSSNIRAQNSEIVDFFFGERQAVTRQEVLLEEGEKQGVKLEIYPNPTVDYVQLGNIDLKEVEKVELYTVEGRRMSAQPRNNRISLIGYESGLYFVKVHFKNGDSAMEKLWKK